MAWVCGSYYRKDSIGICVVMEKINDLEYVYKLCNFLCNLILFSQAIAVIHNLNAFE